MSLFTSNPVDKLPEAEAKEIIARATLLGTSEPVKDCYWACYQDGDKFFIGLNDWPDLWPADAEDIENYCEIEEAK
jgi:hypothetical protein